jgi:hypothetical protein
MGKRASTVQEWFSLNRKELIHCPYQLGNLKISKTSCLMQRRRSDNWVYGTTPDNYILFAVEMHLKVCRQCDQIVAEDGQGADPNPNGRRFKKMGRSPGGPHRPEIQDSRAEGGAVRPRKEQPYGNDHHYREQHQADL